MTNDDEVVLHDGAVLRIVAVRTEDGRCHAEEFLLELRTKHMRAYAQFSVLLQRLGDTGRLRNPEQMRRLAGGGEPPVYEVKAHDGPGWRVYAVRDGHTWYVTHGRKKPKDRAVNAEADRARDVYGRRNR